MTKNKFLKPPLTQEEKEKKAQEFISFADQLPVTKELKEEEPPKKEPIKTLYLRVPKSYWDDIHEIMALTGISMNAVCLELLRPAIKKKLKELKED